jgi:multicomponent Na+:H+ antiporter subunit D
MDASLAPSLLLLAGAGLVALGGARRASWTTVAVLVAALLQATLRLVPGTNQVHLMGETLALGGPAPWQRSLLVGLLAAALAGRGTGSRVAGPALLVLGAGLLGATGGDDLLSWFTWFSVAVLGGVALVAARGDSRSYGAALRGVLPLIVAGFLVIAGAVLRYVHLHTWRVLGTEPGQGLEGLYDSIGRVAEGFTPGVDPGATVLLVGLLALAGAPLLHGWWIEWATAGRATAGAALVGLPFAAAALLAQAFAVSAAPVLLAVGAVQALATLVLAVLADDLRRVLAYGTLSAVGLALVMAAGAGDQAPACVAALLGSQGAALVALWLVAAVLERRIGTTRLSELGGLLRERPGVAVLAGLAALALAGAVPFVAPAALAAEAARRVPPLYAAVPYAALAGLFALVGLKVVVGAFLGADRGWRPEAGGRVLDALALAVPLVGVLATTVAPDLPASGWGRVGDGAVLGVQCVLLGAAAAFVLARGAILRGREPALAPRDIHLAQAVLGRAALRFIEGPLMAGFARLSRFAHETVPTALWHGARNPPGAMMLLYRRLRLAGTSLWGSAEAVSASQWALARDQARYGARSSATPWPIGNIVLYVALLFALYLLLEVL